MSTGMDHNCVGIGCRFVGCENQSPCIIDCPCTCGHMKSEHCNGRCQYIDGAPIWRRCDCQGFVQAKRKR